jgi:surface antigen
MSQASHEEVISFTLDYEHIQSNEAIDTVRRLAHVKRFLGRAALALGLAAGSCLVGEELSGAAVTFTNTYPNSDALLFNSQTYDWWVDENKNGAPDVTLNLQTDDDESVSSRGYSYRNCTDGASYWVKQYTGFDSRGWGNANTWDERAAAQFPVTVKTGAANNIEPGDIAQSDDGLYGHVGFVTSVTKNQAGEVTAITTAELNKNGQGEYSGPDKNRYTTKNSAGKFTRSNSTDWDNFIDVNGTGKGLQNEPLSPPINQQSPTKRPTPGDFNGDGITDMAVFRPSTGTWHIRGVGDFAYGQAGDIPAPADYNGDGKTDIAVYRPSHGGWHIRGVGDYPYGESTDIPVPGDYNGDGSADMAVFRPSTGIWHIRGVGDFAYGQAGDIPVPGYYNADNLLDIAVFRPSHGGWHLRGVGDFPHGIESDIPVPADFTGDAVTDIAVYRPSDGGWRIRAYEDYPHGISSDIPVPGQFNNDKKADAAIFRPADGGWRIRAVGDYPYGTSTDIPAISTLNAKLLKQYGLVTAY